MSLVEGAGPPHSDRLVGFGSAQFCGLRCGETSAGRVQSVACGWLWAEREIQNFVPAEYWVVWADFMPEGCDTVYRARLVKINQKNLI